MLLSWLKYPKQRAINRAPTSLKAIVGPWNNSNVDIFSFSLTTGNSKDNVSSTMVFKTSSGISGKINCFMASYAISEYDLSSIVSKKNFW
ncbi:hypothetical protein JCM19301_2299 [Jejuia pallidilutea]|uniref:Uncharacterized protein n=1 Tax=Jejuia pallidilutea TaxID=504487 RepID=A0A090VV48_9FLAO|nr:hypothetical protein JCM19301_2299 [Jejuia pallidilutea]